MPSKTRANKRNREEPGEEQSNAAAAAAAEVEAAAVAYDPPLESQLPPEHEEEDVAPMQEDEVVPRPPAEGSSAIDAMDTTDAAATAVVFEAEAAAAAAASTAVVTSPPNTAVKAEGTEDSATAADAQTPQALFSPVEEHTEEDTATKTHKLRGKTLFDMIDYHFEVVLRLEGNERRERPIHYNTAMDLMKSFSNGSQKFGRLYVRSLMCKFIIDIFPGGFYSKLASLTDDAEWNKLKTDLDRIRQQCLRKDSVALASGSDKPNAKIVEERSELKQFSRGCANAATYLEMGRLLMVSGLLPHYMSDAEIDIEQSLAEQAFAMIKNSADERATDVLTAKLFQQGHSGEPVPRLKARSELQELFREIKAFRIDHIAAKAEKTVLSMSDVLYPKKPKLFLLKYCLTAKLRGHANMPKKGKTSLRRQTTSAVVGTVIHDLMEDRTALRENHGDDPLEDSRAIGAAAMGNGPSPKRVKTEDDEAGDSTTAHEAAAAAVAATFSQDNQPPPRSSVDDLFEDSSDEEQEAKPKETFNHPTTNRVLHLAEGGPPTSTTVADANNPFYIGPQPDAGVFDEKGNVQIKRPWSEQETEALMYGMRTFGPGKWVQIKNLYGDIFKNRSSVMLKDKYRNLRRQRKLPDDLAVTSVGV